MPSNRGAHPEDSEQFAQEVRPRLRKAVRDLSWLRSRGYTGQAARELVGNRYRLRRRQRNAVYRSACSDAERKHRLAARCRPRRLSGAWLDIDAFNVLISIEAALGGAYLFIGRDSAFRDVNPLQGTYRVVQQTDPAVELLRDTLSTLDVAGVRWHLDRSISNVGRVEAALDRVGASAPFAWKSVIEDDVDARLRAVENPVVTSDSAILDASDAWCHLEAHVHARSIDAVRLVDLRPDGERGAVV